MFAGFVRAPQRRLACLALVLLAASTVGSADRLGRAVELHDQGRRAEARELLEAIVREEPANHRALWNCGLLAMEDEPLVRIDLDTPESLDDGRRLFGVA